MPPDQRVIVLSPLLCKGTLGPTSTFHTILSGNLVIHACACLLCVCVCLHLRYRECMFKRNISLFRQTKDARLRSSAPLPPSLASKLSVLTKFVEQSKKIVITRIASNIGSLDHCLRHGCRCRALQLTTHTQHDRRPALQLGNWHCHCQPPTRRNTH